MKKITLWIVAIIFLELVVIGQSKEGTIVTISGSQLKACTVALKAFSTDEDSADIANFNVEITETKDAHEIAFVPLLAPGERAQRGGGTSLGREVHYLVDKHKNVVIRKFYGR